MIEKSDLFKPARVIPEPASPAMDFVVDPTALLWLCAIVVGGLLLGLLLWRLRGRRTEWVAVDGSNVLYWDDETPMLKTVDAVIRTLRKQGLRPVVWFDANVGYLVDNRYLGPRALARRLGLPEKQVIVAGKGVPADPLVLEGAQVLGARIVTNDRFRDWSDQFPQVADEALFLRGQVRGGVVDFAEYARVLDRA